MDSLRRFFPAVCLPLTFIAGGCVETPKPQEEHRLVYWSAEDFAARLHMRVTQQSSLGVTMTDGRNTVWVFTGGSGLIYVNGQRLGPPNNAV